MAALRFLAFLAVVMLAPTLANGYTTETTGSPAMVGVLTLRKVPLDDALSALNEKSHEWAAHSPVVLKGEYKAETGRRLVSLAVRSQTPLKYVLQTICDQTGTVFDSKDDKNGAIVLRDAPPLDPNLIDDSTFFTLGVLLEVDVKFQHTPLEDTLGALFEVANDRLAKRKTKPLKYEFLFLPETGKKIVSFKQVSTVLGDAIDQACAQANVVYHVVDRTVLFEERPAKSVEAQKN